MCHLRRIVAAAHAPMVIGHSPALIAPPLALMIRFRRKVFCKGDRNSIIRTGCHVLAAVGGEALDRQEEGGGEPPDMTEQMRLLASLFRLFARLTGIVLNVRWGAF